MSKTYRRRSVLQVRESSKKKNFKLSIYNGKQLCYNFIRDWKSAQDPVRLHMQVWFNGRTSAFQAEYVGSIPITCFFESVAQLDRATAF